MCIDCAAGTWSAAGQADACIDCAAGKYSTTASATEEAVCIDCAAGTWSAAGQADACIDCAAGRFSTSTGTDAGAESVCIDCVASTYSGAGEGTACTEKTCEVSGYTDGEPTAASCGTGATCGEGGDGDGYSCTCDASYWGAATANEAAMCTEKTCTDTDGASAAADCGTGATCGEGGDGDGYSCTCIGGYTGTPAGNAAANCVDVDECTVGTGPCDVNAACTNTDGSFTCECNLGYAGDGKDGICADVDECVDEAGNDCDVNAACTNTEGGFTCECNRGYAGDGKDGNCIVPDCTAVDTPAGCDPRVCTGVDQPYVGCLCRAMHDPIGCTPQVCTGIGQPYVGCAPAPRCSFRLMLGVLDTAVEAGDIDAIASHPIYRACSDIAHMLSEELEVASGVCTSP